MFEKYLEIATNKTIINNFIKFTDYCEDDKLKILDAIYSTKILVEKKRKHIKGALAVDAFAVFKEETKNKYRISKKDFYSLYNAFFVETVIVDKEKYNKKIINVVNSIVNLELDFDDAFQSVLSLTSSYTDVEKMVSTLSLKYKNHTKTQLLAVFVTAYKDLSKVKMIKSELKILVITYLYNFFGDCDYVEDNFIVKNYVLDNQYTACNYLIVFPSVNSLNEIIRNYTGNITVVLDNKLLFPYKERCFNMQNFHFLSVQDYLEGNLYYNSIDCTLIFTNSIIDEEGKNDIILKSFEVLKENGVMHIYDSDFNINKLLQYIPTQISIYLSSFILFPSGIQNNANRLSSRKTLATVCRENVDEISVHKYTIKKDDKHIIYLSKKPFVLEIEKEKYPILNNTLRNEFTKFELQNLAKTDRHVSQAEKIEFTNELTIYLTTSQSTNNSKIRLNAYIRNQNNEKIEYSVKSKHMEANNGIEKYNWVTEVYPYKTVTHSKEKYSIRELIIENFIDELKRGDVTLKSLYYLLPDSETKFSKENVMKFRQMLFSSYIGDLLTCELTDDVLINYFDHSTINNQDKIQLSKMIVNLLNMAIEQGFNITNNLSKKGLDIQKRYDDIRKIRQGLMKSFLSKEEISSLISVLEQKILKNNNLAVAVMMSIYTGLDSNIICSLKWKDFNKFGFDLNGVPMYRINIRRQLRNDGSEYVHFDEVKSYRLFPIVTCLANILIRKKKQLLNKGISEDQLLEMPIIEGKQIVVDSIFPVCAPVTLNKYIKNLIENEIMISDLIVNLPLKGGGTVETNLYQYKGNILKSNFQHYGMYECGLYQGELEFLMAKEVSQTLSKHYLDFRNSDVQMIIWEKLNRLPYIFSEPKKCFKKYCNNGVTNVVSYNDGQANLKIQAEFEGNLEIIIRNNYGFKVEVVEVIDNENAKY